MSTLFAALFAGITEGAAIGLVALGFVIVYKATRILNFGQLEIGVVAVYLEWNLVNLGIPVLLSVLIAMAIAAGLGVLNERLFRPLADAPRLTVTVASLGITTILIAFEILRFGINPRTAPTIIPGVMFNVGGFEVKWGHALALAVTAGIGALLYAFFKRSLFGLGVLAVAQDQTALRLQGLPINRVSAFVWATGAAVCALAGMIIAPLVGTFKPGDLTALLAPTALAAALVGGLSSLPGAFVGGIAIGVLQNFAKFYVPGISGVDYLLVFLAMVIVLLFKPNGLMGAKA